jgi:phosphate-selective porin OprO/OprP
MIAMTPAVSSGQFGPTTKYYDPEGNVPSIETSVQDAGEDDDPRPRRQLTKWNEYDGPFSTFRFGLTFLTDFSTYIQDHDSEKQFDLDADYGLRDARVLFRGRFKTPDELPMSWSFGYMYDNADQTWKVRQTGVQFDFPALNGSLFMGRTKEGYSMIKVTSGVFPWGMERSPALDAFVPILADGLKWMGYFPEQRVFFSLGAFADQLSEKQTFSTFDYQAVTRIGWLPIASLEDKTVWHVAVMGRGGRPDDHKIRLRSKPEDSLAGFFVETDSVPSDRAGTAGFETYYRRGSWLFGGEYDCEFIGVDDAKDLSFHAGDVVAVWILTGETRGYNARGGYFEPVSPDRPLLEFNRDRPWLKWGTGAWEAVLHMSYINLNDHYIHGGKLFRLTTLMNWYLTDNVRLEFSYAYGVLDRFGTTGGTNFFQGRVQFTM